MEGEKKRLAVFKLFVPNLCYHKTFYQATLFISLGTSVLRTCFWNGCMTKEGGMIRIYPSFLVAVYSGKESLEVIVMLQLKGDGFGYQGEPAGTWGRCEKY